MELSRGFNVNGYTIIEKIYSAKEYIVYKASKEGLEINLFEFFPAEMAGRYISGEVSINFGQEKAYEELMEKYVAIAESGKEWTSKTFIQIEDMFQDNKTFYFSYKQIAGVSLFSYLNTRGGKINYKEAYDLLTPFVTALSDSFDKGIYYRAEVNNMVVAPEGYLALNAVFRPSYTAQYCMEDIAGIYYTLVTGKQYSQMLVKPSAAGAVLPEMLDNLIYNTLYANSSFAAIGEFYKKVGEAVNVDIIQPVPVVAPDPALQQPYSSGVPASCQGNPISAPPPYPSPGMPLNPPKSNTGKIVAGCSAIGCLALILFFLLFFVGIRSYVSNTESIELSYDEDYDFSIFYMSDVYAYTSFENMNIVFNGTIVEDDDYIYFRTYEDGWALMKESKATGERSVLLHHVQPAFMDIYEGMIFYADGLDDYHLYAVDVSGSAAIKLLDIRSAYIKVYDGRIYFSNLEDWCSLYSINLNGSDLEKHTKYEAAYMGILDDVIYYLDMDYTYNIRAFDILNQTDSLISSIAGDNIIIKDETVYYLDTSTGNVRAYTPEGEEIIYNTFAYVFDVHDNIIYYANNNDLFIHAYNMDTHEDIQLSHTVDALYLSVVNDKLYCYMYYFEELVAYDLYTGDIEYIFEGLPDYFSY